MRVPTCRPKDYDVFAGLDVDKRSIAVTVTAHPGFLRSLRLPYSVEQLLTPGRQQFAAQKSAFASEAGPTGYGLSAGLVAHAYRCLIASPALIPQAPGQRVKTNRLDSRGRSESLRGGHLTSIDVPSPCYRELCHRTQLRATFVREMGALKRRLKARLLLAGSEVPPAPAGRPWSVLVKETLRELPCSPPGRFKREQLRDSLACNEQPVGKPPQASRRFCRHAAERAQGVRDRLTMPGIGWIVASQLLARLGAWRELRDLRQLAGVLGVVPTEHATGDRTERGSLTPTGDAGLRSNLLQAAGSALRQDGEVRECFRAVCQPPPRPLAARVASVAGARKLRVRISGVWMQQRPSEVSAKGHSAPVTPEEPLPQGTTRRLRAPGEKTS